MSHRRVSLRDLQITWHRDTGHRHLVAALLLGAPVDEVQLPAPPPPPEWPDVVPGERTQPTAVQQTMPVLRKPADWPLRIRPVDVDRMAYEAARDVLPSSDWELARCALGMPSNAATDNPRFPVVASVVARCRREVMREVGWTGDSPRSRPRKTKPQRARWDAPSSFVVTRTADGRLLDEDGSPLTEDEAAERLATYDPTEWE